MELEEDRPSVLVFDVSPPIRYEIDEAEATPLFSKIILSTGYRDAAGPESRTSTRTRAGRRQNCAYQHNNNICRQDLKR
jgi:hypothetical protein